MNMLWFSFIFDYIMFTSKLMLSRSHVRILLEVANLFNLIYQQWLTRKEQSSLISLLTLNTQYLLWETTGNFVSGDTVCESNA